MDFPSPPCISSSVLSDAVGRAVSEGDASRSGDSYLAAGICAGCAGAEIQSAELLVGRDYAPSS